MCDWGGYVKGGGLARTSLPKFLALLASPAAATTAEFRIDFNGLRCWALFFAGLGNGWAPLSRRDYAVSLCMVNGRLPWPRRARTVLPG